MADSGATEARQGNERFADARCDGECHYHYPTTQTHTMYYCILREVLAYSQRKPGGPPRHGARRWESPDISVGVIAHLEFPRPLEGSSCRR